MKNQINSTFTTIPANWEYKQINKFARVFDGTHSTPNYVETGIPFYSVEQLTSDNFFNTKFISEEVYNYEIRRVKIEQGDVLMTRIGDIGTSKFINWNVKASFYVSLALFKKVNDSIDFKYFHYFINSDYFKKELHSRTLHVAFPKKINLGDIDKCQVLVPPLPEQKAIADCLSTWDEAIEKQTKLIAAKEQRKKALMQQLLSGKKRLPGFEKKWKLHSIEELFIFKNGKAHENVIDEEGKFILINSKFISSNSQVVKRTNKNLSPLKIDDLVFVMSDVPKGKALGKFFYVDKDGLYTLNQRIGLLQIKTGNPKFMYYLLNRNRHFLSFDNGVGQTNLRKDDILECPLLIPDLDEQNEIANFISFIDREYQLELLKLDKLKTQKKGMMQKLLTGKIRLIA